MHSGSRGQTSKLQNFKSTFSEALNVQQVKLGLASFSCLKKNPAGYTIPSGK
jgi:hypothetical protein